MQIGETKNLLTITKSKLLSFNAPNPGRLPKSPQSISTFSKIFPNFTIFNCSSAHTPHKLNQLINLSILVIIFCTSAMIDQQAEHVKQSYNNYQMLAARLQQTLIKRIEMVENLLLIYAYSELLTIRISEFTHQNQKMYERELILIESCRNLFKVDEKCRRLFYTICCKIIAKLNTKYKPKIMKAMLGKMHGIYFELLHFFKTINEYQMVRVLNKIDLELISQSELFYSLIITLIKYLKSKTDAVIVKLTEKSKNGKIDFYQENSIKKLENQYRMDLRGKGIKRKRIAVVQRKNRESMSIPLRKYHSEGTPEREPHSERNTILNKKTCFLQQKSSLQTNQNTKIDTKTGLKKFQQIYGCEWQKYYTLISPLNEQLQQINVSPKKELIKQRREWIYEYFNSLYQQSLSRNQLPIKSICSNKSSPKSRSEARPYIRTNHRFRRTFL